MSYILTALYAAGDGNTNAAVSYAAALANTAGLPLRIILPYTVPVALGEMPMPLLPVDEVRDAAAGRLAAAVKALQSSHPALSITSEAAYGILGDLLDEACEREAPLITVIGHDGESQDGGDAWIGSAGADMLRESAWPVLAVPGNAPFARPARVCLACDARSIREGVPVAALMRLQAAFGFRITVLHVLGSGGEGAATFAGSALEQNLAGAEANYIEISGEGAVDEAIAAFADGHGIDWLALAPHHYGFWEGLFHKSHTAQVLRLAHVPVVALHA